MRAWLLPLLLIIPVAHGALLEDGTGDVQAYHCGATTSPTSGMDAMDIVSLDIEETPDDIIFTVTAAGLEEKAGPDAGNYFVYLQRGEQHYSIRMYQANSGTGAIAEVIITEGLSPFGPVAGQFPAHIDGATGSISAAIDRDILIDSDGAVPIKGHTMDQILVSAEAHATGVYACPDDSGGGPYIIRDRMPDGWVDDGGASITFRYGGAEVVGPMVLDVERPFRASNGVASTYRFDLTVGNNDTATHEYILTASGLPPGWQWVRPNGTLVLQAGETTTFPTYAVVPFNHQHGVTSTFDIDVASKEGTANGSVQVGIHYLAVPQPAGHHPVVFIHSVADLSIPAPNVLGGGSDSFFWNTLEEDETDQKVGAQAFVRGQDAYFWNGCLGPRLAMGLSPGNGTGSFDLQFSTDAAVSGTLSGTISRITSEQRPANCKAAENWVEASVPLMTFEDTPFSIDGSGSVSGAIALAFSQDIPYESGTDLLLSLTLTPDDPAVGALAPTLMGGRMELPLADFHEPVPDIRTVEDTAPETFVAEPAAEVKESPMLAWPLLAGALLGLVRRQRRA